MEPEKAFKACSRILFGQEIGELHDFRDYLSEFVLPLQTKKSFISGKDVWASHPYYPANAKFISQDEIDKLKFPPLNPNDIKDIDSLISAVKERVVFCGNKIQGNCHNVTNVDNCVECSDIINAHNVFHVTSSAYTSYVREAEFVFGVGVHPLLKYSMRCLEGIHLNRCFECYYSSNLSDSYYSFNCSASSDCIFSFNQRSKRNMIGNVQLTKEKYLELKKKLISELAEELKKNKRAFTISDMTNRDLESGSGSGVEAECEAGKPPAKVEEAFTKATGLVLGVPRTGIDKYGPWFSKRILNVRKVKGALGTPTYKVDGLPSVRNISARKLVTAEEALKMGSKKIRLSEEEISKASVTLNELMARASSIAYFSFEFHDGFNENVVDVPTVFTGTNLYNIWDSTNSKYCGYSSAPIESSYIFGGYLRILSSEFCINCFDATNLKRCFECDSSYSGSDNYFCHNSENLNSCLFCFNAKNLRYAVGNTEVGKEEFARIKKILLDHINKKLDEKKSLDLSIFSI